MNRAKAETLAAAYFTILVISVMLLLAAVWDFAYLGQQYQGPILGGLVVMAVATVVLLGITYVLRRGEQEPAPTYLAPPVPATQLESSPPAPAAAPDIPEPATAPPASAPPAAVTTRSARVVVAEPKGAAAAADEPTQLPEQIPGPTRPPDRKYGDVENLAYEIGDPGFQGTAPESPTGQHQARVLCGDCGAFFSIFTGQSRPIQINCLDCNKRLGLSGTVRREAPHVWVRCKLCGQYQPVLQSSSVESYLCPTCGQRNSTADLPSGTPMHTH